MIELQDYYSRSPLKEDLARVSDPDLDFDRDREKMNRLVLNVVIKYLALYLRVTGRGVLEIRKGIMEAIGWKKTMADRQDRQEGMQFDAVYKSPAPGNDHYGILCAADIHRSAALFKEIACGGRFINNGRFHGLDLGSGTGIMTLAMAVAAARNRVADLHIVGIERSGMAVRRSQEVLDEVLGEGCASMHNGDIREEGRLASLYREPIHYWVSETISINTPKLDLARRDFGLTEDQRLVRRIEGGIDPFPEVLRVSMDEIPLFKPCVLRGATAMVPDLFNHHYRPDEGESTLELKTAPTQKPKILERVGEEFEPYEDLGLNWKRWYSAEDFSKVVRVRET